MKKLIYTGAFALTALVFTSCSETSDKFENATNDVEMGTEKISQEKKEEMDKALKLQEEAEKLDEELSEFNKALKN